MTQLIFGDIATEQSDDILQNTLNGYKAFCPSVGVANSISVYLTGWSSGNKVKCALYDEALNFVAETQERTTGGANGWFTFNFVSPPALTIQNYYIVTTSDSYIGFKYYIGSSVMVYAMANTYTNGYPSALNPASFLSNIAVSIYCTYTTTASYASLQYTCCLGDSITFGDYATTSYPKALATLSGYWVLNEGHDGWKTSDANTRWNNIKTSGFNNLVLMIGVNDHLSAVNETTIENNLTATWTSARALGINVYALTVSPDSGNLSTLTTLNTFIKINAPILGCQVIDIYDLLNNSGNNGNMQAQYDSGDHVHPNQTGLNLIANAVYSAMNPDMGGSTSYYYYFKK